MTPGWQVAQFNVARMRWPLDHPSMGGFVDRLDEINALAEGSPGFVWRLQDESGDATAIRTFGEQFIVNMSLWQSIEALFDFTYRTAHAGVFKLRKHWFEVPSEAHLALWWQPAGAAPTPEEGRARLEHLRAHGPSVRAFTLKRRFPAPEPAKAHLLQS